LAYFGTEKIKETQTTLARWCWLSEFSLINNWKFALQQKKVRSGEA